MKNKIVTSVLLFIFFISQFVHTPIVSSEEFQGKGSLEQQHLSDGVSVEESSSSSFEEYSTISDGDVLESSISEDVESMMDSSYEIINNTIDSVEDSFETFEESQSSNLKNVVETSIEQYATIISNDFVLWEDLTFQKEKAKSQEYFQQTLYVEKEFAFSDGLKVVSIKNIEDQILGYINPDSLFYSTDKGGMFIADSKFVTIISKDMDIWENLSLTNKIENGNDYYSKTLEVKGKYHHFDGSVYYSVYSNKGEWIGYINENGVQVATGEQGIYHNYEQYATLIGNYSIWDGFTWENSVDSIEYKNQTFIAKGIYYHFNGSNYLSIYDNTGDWIGYINEAGAILSSGDEGPYVPYDNYVTINGTYNFWNSFNWEKEISSSDYQNQTLHAKGIYYHFSGASYLSVYDNIGNWIGYINQEGTTLSLSEAGTFFEYDQYVSVLGTYDIWDSFNWLNATDSSIYLNQTLHAKGIYYHFNGSRYLSLYNNTGDWVGYINQEGVKEASGPQGVYEKYEKHVTIKSNKYEIWKNFSWSQKAVGNFSGKTYLAKGLYNHFNGSKYLSLYDANNSWIGYINEDGTKIAHSQAEKYNKVQELLNNEYKNNNFGIYVKSLTDGSTAQTNSNQQFHAASTGKLPALYYTQKMISEKK